MALLEVDDLQIALPQRGSWLGAVRGLHFSMQAGETLGLVGESGCGKSLTALALMGLLPEGARVQGQVRLDGTDLLALDDRAWQGVRGHRVAMIFQEPMTALNPLHPVGHQVAEPLRRHKRVSASEAQRAAIAVLERVGIPDAGRRARDYPHQFSGGQRQRIMIAMALICEPSLLIADEPTTALDVTVQRQILALIDALVRERSMGLLLISHDLPLIARSVRRVLVMYGGQAMEYGPTDAVFEHPAHPYTKGLLRARPTLGARRAIRLETIPGQVPALEAMPSGCPFAPRCALRADACEHGRVAVVQQASGQQVACVMPPVQRGLVALAVDAVHGTSHE